MFLNNAALATGGAVVVGQYLGQKKDDEARSASDQLVLSAFLLSVVIVVIMYIFKNGIMSLVFGDIEADVRHYCDIYYLTNQSIPKEINPEYSLDELMLRLKLQYFGHLM